MYFFVFGEFAVAKNRALSQSKEQDDIKKCTSTTVENSELKIRQVEGRCWTERRWQLEKHEKSFAHFNLAVAQCSFSLHPQVTFQANAPLLAVSLETSKN